MYDVVPEKGTGNDTGDSQSIWYGVRRLVQFFFLWRQRLLGRSILLGQLTLFTKDGEGHVR